MAEARVCRGLIFWHPSLGSWEPIRVMPNNECKRPSSSHVEHEPLETRVRTERTRIYQIQTWPQTFQPHLSDFGRNLWVMLWKFPLYHRKPRLCNCDCHWRSSRIPGQVVTLHTTLLLLQEKVISRNYIQVTLVVCKPVAQWYYIVSRYLLHACTWFGFGWRDQLHTLRECPGGLWICKFDSSFWRSADRAAYIQHCRAT